MEKQYRLEIIFSNGETALSEWTDTMKSIKEQIKVYKRQDKKMGYKYDYKIVEA